MKKLFLLTPIATLLLPGVAFAAYNSVSLTTDASLSVNSITLNVSGSTADIESIKVDSSNFSVVLQEGSKFKVSAPSHNQISYDVIYAGTRFGGANYTCTSATSTLEVLAVSSTTLIVTPSASLCADTVETASAGLISSERGRGSSGSNVVSVPAVVAQTPAPTVTASNPSRVTLQANLSKGSRGSEVKALQQFLNTHGFVIVASGPGSPGNETTTFGDLTLKAVQKFQKKYGIASSGNPATTGYGRVGPMTRTKINELSAK